MEKIPDCPYKQGTTCAIKLAVLPYLPEPLSQLQRLSNCRIEHMQQYYRTASRPDMDQFDLVLCPMALAMLQLFHHIPEDIRPII
ncbi:MAG: hypothetical protein WC489_06635 [Patescibacteria group bacterium]